ncbi:MAG: hypothetical protein HRU23_10210 [Gammaproteobacteria bacterium]|nr:hypothetical protein [Gammaproteobacteria bacterium]
MRKSKSLNIFVVGHTDDKGNSTYNVKPSKRRATADKRIQPSIDQKSMMTHSLLAKINESSLPYLKYYFSGGRKIFGCAASYKYESSNSCVAKT